MKKLIAIALSAVLALSLCACAGNGGILGGEKEEESKKVTASLLTELVMIEKNSDGDNDTMKAVLEYDEDYNIIGAKTYQNDTLLMEATYDKDMNKPLVQQEYDEDGSKTNHREYTYDDDGNELTNYYYDEDGEINWGYEYTYDADGNILTEKVYGEEGLESEVTYTYDADGNMLTWTQSDGDRTVYTYNADGLLEKEVSYYYDGEPGSWVTYTYDDHGNKLTQTNGYGADENTSTTSYTYENTYDGDKLVEVKEYCEGELTSHSKYDADGNQILSVSYWSGEETYRTETTYENGKVSKEATYSSGDLTYCQENTYNANGKLTERNITYSDGETMRQVYTYNDSGDLASMKSYDGDELDGEYTLTYETVTVSKDVAKKIAAITAMLGI